MSIRVTYGNPNAGYSRSSGSSSGSRGGNYGDIDLSDLSSYIAGAAPNLVDRMNAQTAADASIDNAITASAGQFASAAQHAAGGAASAYLTGEANKEIARITGQASGNAQPQGQSTGQGHTPGLSDMGQDYTPAQLNQLQGYKTQIQNIRTNAEKLGLNPVEAEQAISTIIANANTVAPINFPNDPARKQNIPYKPTLSDVRDAEQDILKSNVDKLGNLLPPPSDLAEQAKIKAQARIDTLASLKSGVEANAGKNPAPPAGGYVDVNNASAVDKMSNRGVGSAAIEQANAALNDPNAPERIKAKARHILGM